MLTLVLLAIATLTVMTTETLPVGLLPQMAFGLGATEAELSLLISVYGAVVVIGAVPLSILVSRVAPRAAMIGVLVAFIVSVSATAASTDITVALAARVAGGAAHAVFYSCSFTVATSVVSPEWKGRAIALVAAGNALALALGVPAGTALGVGWGWQAPFWASAGVLVVIVMGFVISYRPLSAPPTGTRPSTRMLLRAIRSWPLARVALTIILIMGAHFLTYTFVSPTLTRAGVPADLVSVVLVGYGLTGVLSLILAGRWSDTRPRRVLITTVALTAVALGMLFVGQRSTWIVITAIVVWGAAFGAAPALWQLIAVRAAPAAASIGPAVVNSAFNVGISLGAFGGGALLAAFAPADLALPSLALVAIALVLVLRRGWLPGDREATKTEVTRG